MRWTQSTPFERLPAGRQLALRLVDGIEDAFLVLHLAVLGFVAFVHLVAPTRGFLFFIAGYETLLRDYWFIERMEHGEYGMWPGIVTALGLDALYMVLLVLPAVLPFVIARHYIVRDQRSLKDVLGEYALLSVFALLAVYVVGSVAGTFVVLIAGGLAGAFADVGGLLAPVGSGILMTDLLFATTMWWMDRADAPRGMTRWIRLALEAAGAMALIIGVELFVTVQAHVDANETDRLMLFLQGKEIEHEGKNAGLVHQVRKLTSKRQFRQGQLVAPSGQRLHFFAPGKPLLLSRDPFYHSPPDELWFDGRTVHLSYALHPWTEQPKRTVTKVTLRPDEGKGFYDQYEHVFTDRQDRNGFVIDVKAQDVSAGVSAGFVAHDSNGNAIYVMVDGSSVHLYEVATLLVELAKHQAKKPVGRVGLFTRALFGSVLTIDGRPVWVLSTFRPDSVGPAMMRRPKLKPGDTGTFNVTVDAAPKLDHEVIERSYRVISPVL